MSSKLPQRMWLSHNRSTNSNDYNLKVMSYNLLAPCYTFMSHFINVSASHIQWYNRSKLIINEIQSTGFPHIVSFQEYEKVFILLNNRIKPTGQPNTCIPMVIIIQLDRNQARMMALLYSTTRICTHSIYIHQVHSHLLRIFESITQFTLYTV